MATILIVDDERQNRALLEAMLAPDGFELQAASSGEEALAMVAQQSPDLILLDIMMPGMDGYEVVRRIKGNVVTKNIPVIMVTALDDRESRMLGLNAGAEDLLTKPVDRAELRARVKNLLRLKAYSDDHDNYNQVLEREITSRTAELAESDARFRQIAETIPEFVFLVDERTGVTLYASPAYEHIFGRSRESLRLNPLSWREAIHPDDRDRLLEAMRQDGTPVPFDVEHRIVRPAGEVRTIRVRGIPVRNSDGEIYRLAGIAEDISERRVLESQVRQAGKMDAMGQLAAGVAHDFNNLLTVILGFSEMVTKDNTLADGHRKDLEEVIKAGRRASSLTKQLLAFSRQQVLETAPLDVNGLITDMSGMLGRLIGEHVQIEVALAPSLPLVLADRGQLEQVVMNLLVNARDAMPSGGRVMIETAEVELENSEFHEETVERGRYVMLGVTDTGIGMNAETRRRLFEPFFTTKIVGEGTGLGLATVYGIVKQCKGHIWVYSEPGQGTTFKVYLPSLDGGVSSPDLRRSDAVSLQQASETVLLVEDEAGLRLFVKRILVNAGYRVLEAVDGDDGERVFNEQAGAIDLLVTDVVMPGCGGPALLARLQVHSPSVRVLFMSGYTEHSAARTVPLDPRFPFIQKPFSAAEFLRRVRDALVQ